eukprot:1777066-Rhodomonas_salina.1
MPCPVPQYTLAVPCPVPQYTLAVPCPVPQYTRAMSCPVLRTRYSRSSNGRVGGMRNAYHLSRWTKSVIFISFFVNGSARAVLRGMSGQGF